MLKKHTNSRYDHWFKVPLIVMPVIIQDEKVLLGLRKNTGYMDGCYGLPGGKHDGMETLKQSVAREIKEEVGIECRLDDIEFKSFIHIMDPVDENNLKELAYFVFKIEKFEGEVVNAEPHKCERVDFFPINRLPKNITKLSKMCIEYAINDISYGELGWEKFSR